MFAQLVSWSTCGYGIIFGFKLITKLFQGSIMTIKLIIFGFKMAIEF